MDGKEIVNAAEAYYAPPSQRNLNLVFQSYALWPHMTVFENVSFGLKIKKIPSAEIEKMVASALERMQIGQYAKRYPTELSGGQQQRVAIASTIIYVTHDQVEALTMSTKIALFREGELVQVDKPLELYDNPCDLYTADFIGNPSINFVEASGTAGASGLSVDGVMGRLEFSREDMTPEAPASGDLKLVLGIRPEQITISREKTDAAQVEARVYAGMPAGSETLVSVRVGEKLITVKELGSTHYAGDETVYLSYPPKKVNVFDASTKRLIKYSR